MQSKQKLIIFLTSTPFIDVKTAEIIAENFEEKEILKNDFFLKEGKVNNEYLFLAEGFLRGFVYDTEGNDVTTTFFTALKPVFEVSSFFNRTPSKENIQALTDCKGWYLDFEKLNQLFHTIPAFREFGRSVLVKGFTSLKDRMLSQLTATAEERYASLLLSDPDVFQYAPLKHIASYLGITDTSLSRIRKDFAKSRNKN